MLGYKKVGEKSLSFFCIESFAAIFSVAWLASRTVLWDMALGTYHNNGDFFMGAATLCIALRAAGLLAVPLVSYKLWEKRGDRRLLKKLSARLAVVAMLFEIPYNLITDQRFFAPEGKNPLFSVAICAVMLYFFSVAEGSKMKGWLFAIIVLSALSWALILKAEEGVAFICITTALCLARKDQGVTVAGCIACGACTAISLYYVFTPAAFIITHYFTRTE